MAKNKKLKKLIPSKKQFDMVCASAYSECPQTTYFEYMSSSTNSRRKIKREELIRYWAENEVLWKYGYYKSLPENVLKVFAWWKRY